MLMAVPQLEAKPRAVPGGKSSAAVEPRTFDDIYRNYFDFVWRLSLRLGVDEAAAEDVAQEVFFVVHQKLASFEQRSSLRTWIFEITRRVVSTHRRTEARRRVKHAEAQHAGTSKSVSTPESELKHVRARELLYSILDELDEPRREVFVLAELEGMSQVEIAEMLSVKLNTVYSRLRSARELVMQALARLRARDGWRSQ